MEVRARKAALSEGQRRLRLFEEEEEGLLQKFRRKPRRRRRSSEEEIHCRQLQRLADEGAALDSLAEEQMRSLRQSAEVLQKSIELDQGPVEEIEAWRQLVGLQELQAVTAALSRHLEVSTVNSSERAAARAYCQEMQGKLENLRAEEEEAQRLRLRQRPRRDKASSDTAVDGAVAASKAREALEEAAKVVAAAQGESAAAGLVEARGKLRVFQEEIAGSAALLAEEVLPRPALSESIVAPIVEKAPTASPTEVRARQLAQALEDVETRAQWASLQGSDLVKELEEIFQSSSTQGGQLPVDEVAAAVDRWRRHLATAQPEASLPGQDESEDLEAALGPERWQQATRALEGLGKAAEEVVKSHLESGETAREALLATWRKQMESTAELEEQQLLKDQAAMRARAAARKRERKKRLEEAAQQQQQLRVDRWTAQPAKPETQQHEVKKARVAAEAVARSLLRHAEQDAEEQVQICLRRVAERGERLASRSFRSESSFSTMRSRSLSRSPTKGRRHGASELLNTPDASWAWRAPESPLSVTLRLQHPLQVLDQGEREGDGPRPPSVERLEKPLPHVDLF